MGKRAETRISRLIQSKAFESIQKQFGASAVTLASERKTEIVPRLRSGIMPLDYALGGGWPIGRISVVYGHKSTGKSTLMTLAAASAQQTCRVCCTTRGPDGQCLCKDFQDMSVVYIDVEGSYEAGWGRNLGCDPDRMLIARPDFAEQALDILEALIRSKECDVIILDSIAFLTPTKEIEESVSKDQVGLQARISGKAVRKFNAAMNTVGNQAQGWKPTILLTNQIRMKVGLLFGCFHGDTPVMFADGSQHRIQEVVQQRLSGPVLSWDGTRIVSSKITNWFNNGPMPEGDSWLTFRVAGTNGLRGAQGFTCTRNHILVTGDGREVSAGDVCVGDTLLSWYYSGFRGDVEQVLTGSLFGDGHITKHGAVQLANSEQLEYLNWKMSVLGGGFRRVASCGREFWRTQNSYEYRLWRKRFYDESGFRQIPLGLLREATPLSLAVWFMDDGSYKETHRSGSISVKRLSVGEGAAVADVLAEQYPGVTYSSTQRAIILPTHTFSVFSEDIAIWVPVCMSYKLLPEHRGNCGTSQPRSDFTKRRVPTEVRIVKIHESARKNRSRNRFDLQIEGNSFYLVGGDSAGVVVHNSPETQPGGFAWGFAASNEVKCKGGKYQMDEDSGRPLYVDIDFRVDKNKTAVPKMEGTFRLLLSDTETKSKGQIADEDFIVKQMERLGILTGAGSSWKIGDRSWKGKKYIVEQLEKDPEFNREIREMLLMVLLAA